MRLKRRGTGNGKEREIRESEKRLKQTREQWPEVMAAQQQLDKIIQQALRGGQA